MSTRGFKFNQVHVEALCSVEVEWSGAKDAEVRSAWKAYNYHLNKMVPDDINDPANIDWRNTVDELFANLIVELSKSVGKPVDKTDVNAGSYGPKLWWEIQQETNLLRKGLLSIIGSGRGVSIPVSVQYDAAVMNAIEKAGNAAQASNTTPQLKS